MNDDTKDYANDHPPLDAIPASARLPRRDLREKAFRKYEPFMAQAILHGSFHVKAWEFPGSPTRQMKSANTFICRFQDAQTGYRRYKYTSSLIPKDFDISNLKCTELLDGSVLIENNQFSYKASRPILSSDHDGLRILAAKIKRGEIHSKASIPIQMVEETYTEDLAFIEMLQGETSEFYGHFATKPKPENGILWVLMD